MINEILYAMEKLDSAPCSIRRPLILFPVARYGSIRYQYKMFKEHGGFGYEYFYWPNKGYYDCKGRRYKDLSELEAKTCQGSKNSTIN